MALLAGAVSTAAAPAAQARFTAWKAEDACKSELRREYGADTFRHVTTAKIAKRRFEVSGRAERRGKSSDRRFTCKVVRGQVQDVSMKRWKTGGSSTGGKVLAVAAGALVGAAIIGAISKHHKHQEHRHSDDWDRRDWDDDSYSPHEGVDCYEAQRACYDEYGDYSSKWTRREF